MDRRLNCPTCGDHYCGQCGGPIYDPRRDWRLLGRFAAAGFGGIAIGLALAAALKLFGL